MHPQRKQMLLREFEADDATILDELRESVDYWREALLKN